MKLVKGILGYLWKFYFLFLVFITLLILYPLYLFLLQKDSLFNIGFHLIRFQAKFILFFAGIRPKIHGKIPNDKNTTYIICPNHSSYLDILLLYYTLPNYFIFLGKKELGKIPLFNIFFKKMNILVDRANAKAAHDSIKKACKQIEKGRNLVIFPEGTIPKSVPQLKPFKNGAFKVALELGIDIIPISFKDNYRLLEDSMKIDAKWGIGQSNVFIHPPIKVKQTPPLDLLTLRQETKSAIESKLN